MGNKKTIWLIIILLLLASAGLFYKQIVTYLRIRESRANIKYFANLDKQLPKLNKENPRRGNEQAQLVIFEYSDFQCPFCSEMEKVTDEIIKKYESRVLLVWKDFPNLITHEEAEPAAIAARCANEQNKFWEYSENLFASQDQLNPGIYAIIAKKINLDETKFLNCLDDPEMKNLVEGDLDEGLLLGVDATPYFFIGNTRVSGYLDTNQFEQAIKSELNK